MWPPSALRYWSLVHLSNVGEESVGAVGRLQAYYGRAVGYRPPRRARAGQKVSPRVAWLAVNGLLAPDRVTLLVRESEYARAHDLMLHRGWRNCPLTDIARPACSLADGVHAAGGK